MSRNSTLILLGILTILTPFSGLPIAIRSLLLVMFGVCVFGIGLTLRAREVRNAHSPADTPISDIPEAVSHEPQGVSPI